LIHCLVQSHGPPSLVVGTNRTFMFPFLLFLPVAVGPPPRGLPCWYQPKFHIPTNPLLSSSTSFPILLPFYPSQASLPDENPSSAGVSLPLSPY
jgi:hypothetical protein